MASNHKEEDVLINKKQVDASDIKMCLGGSEMANSEYCENDRKWLNDKKNRFKNVSKIVLKLESIVVDSDQVEVKKENYETPQKLCSKIKLHRPLQKPKLHSFSPKSLVPSMSNPEKHDSHINRLVLNLKNKLEINQKENLDGEVGDMKRKNQPTSSASPGSLGSPLTAGITNKLITGITPLLNVLSKRQEPHLMPINNLNTSKSRIQNEIINLDIFEVSSDSDDEWSTEVSDESDKDSSDGISGLLDYEYVEPKAIEILKERELSGYSLYRCGNGKCCFSSENNSSFQDHQLVCEFSEIQFDCFHCLEQFNLVPDLLEHLKIHGPNRFSCGLCKYKSPLSTSVKSHLKLSHKVGITKMLPVTKTKNSHEDDSFVIVPEKAIFHFEKSKHAKDSFTPDEIEIIPPKPEICRNPIRCHICDFSTKVRSNLVKHLKLHLAGVNPPDIAPVNPSPIVDEGYESNYNRMKTNNNGKMKSNLPTDLEEKIQVPLTDEIMSQMPQLIPETLRFACNSNGCRFITSGEELLVNHIKARHPNLKKYDCPHCEEVMVPLEDVQVHLNCHGDDLFKCSNCMYYHWQKRKVEKHGRDVHNGEVVVVQDVRAEADIKEKLKNKGRKDCTSTYEPYKCGLCDESNENITGIKKHCKEVHKIDMQFKCWLCHEASNVKNDMINHASYAHEESVSCVLRAHFVDSVTCTGFVSEKKRSPLWKRQMGGLKQIRGILLDESDEQQAEKKKIETGPAPKRKSVEHPVGVSRKKVKIGTGDRCELNLVKRKVDENENENFPRNERINGIEDQIKTLELSPFKLCRSYKCFYCPKISQNLDQINRHRLKLHRNSTFKYLEISRNEMINLITDEQGNGDGKYEYKCFYCETFGDIIELKTHTESVHLGNVLKVINSEVTGYLECQLCGYLSCGFEKEKQTIHVQKEHPFVEIVGYSRYISKIEMGTNAFTNPNQTFKFDVREAFDLIYHCPHKSVQNNSAAVTNASDLHTKGELAQDKCSCAFSTKVLSQMNNHLRTHTRTYKCGHCGQTSPDSSEFHRHSALSHENKSPCLIKDPEGEAEYEGLKGLLEWNVQKELADRALRGRLGNSTLTLALKDPKTVSGKSNMPESRWKKGGKCANVAKKSTGPRAKCWPETRIEIPYSFYNIKPDDIDLKSVKTRISLGKSAMPLNGKEVGQVKILQPRLVLEDCQKKHNLWLGQTW